MKIVYLEYFVQVVKSGSISKAANILFLKQSNLSKYIKQLEDYFGTILFDRKYNGCQLTEDGKKVYDFACSFLEQTNSLRKSFQKGLEEQNNVKTQIIDLYVNPTINYTAHSSIIDFSLHHPELQLNIIEKDIYTAIDEIQNNPNSLMLSVLDQYFMTYIKENTSLVLLPVSTTYFTIYTAHINSVLPKQHSISLKNLEKLPLLLYAPTEIDDSPVIEMLTRYTDLNISKVVSNSSMFHTLLQTGQYIAIGIKASDGMQQYKEISIREKIPLQLCFLLNNSYSDNDTLLSLLQHYYNNKNLAFSVSHHKK